MLELDNVDGKKLDIGPIYYIKKGEEHAPATCPHCQKDISDKYLGPVTIKAQMYQSADYQRKISFDAPRDIYIGRPKKIFGLYRKKEGNF